MIFGHLNNCKCRIYQNARIHMYKSAESRHGKAGPVTRQHSIFGLLTHRRVPPTVPPLRTLLPIISSIMLPRNLRSLALSRRGLNALGASHQTVALPRIPHRARLAVAGFHSSSSRRNELPKSPFQTFVDVLRDELRKNRELQDNVKQLQGDVDKLQDSEALKKARAMYERARVCVVACSNLNYS